MTFAYRVREVFRSIQGEGFWTGSPAVFVRFSGCNLDCEWCDTDHESRIYPFAQGELLAEVAKDVAGPAGIKTIVLTGGEPLLQVGTSLLVALVDAGFERVAIETNGTLRLGPPGAFNQMPGDVRGRVWVTVSPKDPAGLASLEIQRADEVKVVVPGNGWRKDQLSLLAEFARQTWNKPCLFLQPEWGEQYEEAKTWAINYILNEDPRWRLSLQTQRWIDMP